MTAPRIATALFAFALTAFSATSAFAQDTAQPSRTTATYGGWTVDCYASNPVEGQDAAPNKRCEMLTKVMMQVENGTGGGLLLQIGIGPNEDDSDYWVVMQTPLNVLLREEVRLFLDVPEGEGVSLPEPLMSTSYLYCEPGRCLTRGVLTAEQMTRLTEAESITARFVGRQGREFILPLVMDGLADATKAMDN
ncbi:invasion associated locus B family protein [Rhodobacteraceae bacterium KMM 6894]|nr:invasion associated locus B family protein [Rhodobacteraceae bacterium KMM 6894]